MDEYVIAAKSDLGEDIYAGTNNVGWHTWSKELDRASTWNNANAAAEWANNTLHGRRRLLTIPKSGWWVARKVFTTEKVEPTRHYFLRHKAVRAEDDGPVLPPGPWVEVDVVTFIRLESRCEQKTEDSY